MATRAATFTAKIRNLKDYHYRMVNNMSPMPSGLDIANTLKYFSQTLLSVLKDVPIIPSESYGPRQQDSIRLAVFPSLNYSGLYDAVVNILDLVPIIQYGQHHLGEAILNVFGCLVPFLEYDLLDTLPYTVASTLAFFPQSLQKDTIELLCTNLLPVTLGYKSMNDNPTYATDSTAAIIMVVLQYVESGECHSQLLECIMSMKRNVMKDLLSVIAYGPPLAKAPAVNHLFHYWPQLNLALTDRRGIHYKYLGFNFVVWKAVSCQRENCPNAGDALAVKMCLDPAIAIQCGDKPPPLYVCASCVDQLKKEHVQFLSDILRPLEKVSLICENKNCTSPKNQAVSTCFSIECASFNGNRPIRYCTTCHHNRHNSQTGVDHIFHMTVSDVWSCDPELQGYLVEAIVSLMKEASPLEEKRVVEMGEDRMRQQHFEDDEDVENAENDERKLLSRYGIWLMVELCKPKEGVPIEILGRLLAMLFQWFDCTAYLPDDNIGNALERLKPEYIYKWLQAVCKTHFEVVLSCLLPHPVEYARVGGHWDTLSSRTSQIKEGLNRLFCLVPYDIITYAVWDYVMPFWLEAIRTEVPEEERQDLKVLLCKTFDTEMCPLPFSVDKMYHFMIERFDNTIAPVQEQNLSWLQILSSLETLIPLQLLLSMFKTGVHSLANPPQIPDPPQLQMSAPPDIPLDDLPPGSPLSPELLQGEQFVFDTTMQPEEKVTNITCLIMMLDLLIKQIELQDALPNQGIYNDTCCEIMQLLTNMLHVEWEGKHTCLDEDEVTDCCFCEVSALWHQLATDVMKWVASKNELMIPVKDLPKVEELQHRQMSENKGSKTEAVDKTKEKPKVEQSVAAKDEAEEQEKMFDIPALPTHLQLLHCLLKTLDKETDSDALFFMLKSVKLLCLHAEALNLSQQTHDDFVRYCLKYLMIPNLWKLLQAEHSQIASVCVPLLLHCLTFNSGADVLWRLVEEDFNNEDWRARFSAVEKATMLARLMNPESVQNNQVILTALAHIFCYLIGSMNDINSSVVQRTNVYLETIKQSSIKCMCQCLEFQFDSVIADRTMILQRVYMLQHVLKEEEITTWEFFLNRFDTLCLEAQLDLESSGDIACLTDLTSSDRQSDHFLKKINRARFALARTDSVRSLSGSIYNKPPYRRAASVPLHLVAKTGGSGKEVSRVDDINQLKPYLELLMNKDKDKAYTRQQSAPQFGRRDRGSRFGMGMFSNYMFPGGNLREFTDEESNFAALLQRAMDLEGVDRETVHELVTLLMKFMVHSDEERVNEDRDMSRAENIVLRHLNVLLGYNQTEKAFSVPPYKLRYSAVFSAYLSGLPIVLDKNFQLGNIILPVAMQLLQYAPSPQRYASDYQPPNYTLWYLEPHARQSWLYALLVILYKYQYNTVPASTTIQTLIRLAINTIEAQLHRCRRHDDPFAPSSPVVPRNRDTSNVSIGDLEQIQETDTPPQSPTSSQQSLAGDTVTINMAPATTVHYKKKAESDKTEETDIESPSPTPQLASPASKPTSPQPVSTSSTTNAGDSAPTTSGPPTSPTSRDSSPSKSPAKGCRGFMGSPRTRSPPQVGSPTEEFARMQKDQPRRIAEYGAISVTEVRDTSPSGGQPRNSPLTKSKPFKQQRTLEQSMEAYVLQQAGLHPPDIVSDSGLTPSPATSPCSATSASSSGPPPSVEQKMVEQLAAFASMSEAKKKESSKEDSVIPTEEAIEMRPQSSSPELKDSLSGDEATTATTKQSPDRSETAVVAPPPKKPQCEIIQEREPSAGEEGDTETPPSGGELREPVSGTEELSPRRLMRPPLGKTQSAGAVEGLTEGDELARARQRAMRTMSEKSHSLLEEALLEAKGIGEDESDLEESPLPSASPSPSPSPSPTPTPQLKPNYRQRKARKTGLTTVELQKMIPELGDLGMEGLGSRRSNTESRRQRKGDQRTRSQQSLIHKRSLAALRLGDQIQVDKCPECHVVLEQYDEDTISLCIVALATFIHREPSLAAPLLLDMLKAVTREPSLAAPLLLDMLKAVTRIAAGSPYPWQAEISGLIIPGNSVSVARQFLRCVVHQLAPNGIFPQIFMTEIEDPDFLKTLAASLVDFTELNCYSALQSLLEGINTMKNLTPEQMQQVVVNLAQYMDYIALETSSPTWQTILVQFDLFFRNLPAILPPNPDMKPVLQIMIAVLKIPGLSSVKTILEPFSKILSYTIQNCSFKLQQVLDICSLCSRAFTKDRDKLYLSRSIIFELVQALKFKSPLPDENLLMLVQFVCMDAGGVLGPTNIVEEMSSVNYNPYTQSLISTNAAEGMKQHLSECVEFIADLHTINKMKVENENKKNTGHNLNEDTLGSHLKAGIAQFVALEFTRGNGRDNRAISRYLPWLYHPPSAMQSGTAEPTRASDPGTVGLNSPKEFIDCVSHIRLLSWLLLGSLTHTAITKAAGHIVCQPIPLEASAHIADHIMVIMTGFAEQSKASVLHMSSLFHAFILCQLWTMYCECSAALCSPVSDNFQSAQTTIMDFWGRVTPGILQLLSHSKVLAEMVNLHFLSLMEALQECNSTLLSRMFPLWIPILFSYHSQLPGHMQVRLQMCQNWEPRELKEDSSTINSTLLLDWLKKLQFKLGQIEVQSSAATQFYTV